MYIFAMRMLRAVSIGRQPSFVVSMFVMMSLFVVAAGNGSVSSPTASTPCFAHQQSIINSTIPNNIRARCQTGRLWAGTIYRLLAWIGCTAVVERKYGPLISAIVVKRIVSVISCSIVII